MKRYTVEHLTLITR